MARRNKEALLQIALAAFEGEGWQIQRLSALGEHPARFTLTRGNEHRLVRLYVWNLSHGGRSRSEDEFRIQITGIDQFELEPDGQTLILGWSDDFGVFAGFDVRARLQPLGSSPSIQINTTTLTRASSEGAAVQPKRKGEFAAAIRPDRLGAYVRHLEDVHAGDIGPLVNDAAEASKEDDVARQLAALLESSATFDFSRDGDAELRGEVRAKAEALLAALGGGASHGQLGHNNPPEPIDEDLLPQAKDAAELILDQSVQENPDAKKTAEAAGFLAWAAKALRALRTEGEKLLEKAKDIGREHAAKAIGGVVGGALVGLKDQLATMMAGLAHSVLKWLQLAAGIF